MKNKHPGTIAMHLLPATMSALCILLAAPSANGAAPPAPAVSAEPARVGAELELKVGKSTILRLPDPVDRVSIGNPAVADVTTLSERELYLLGKDMGSTNVIIWSRNAAATVIDVRVGADTGPLEKELAALLPGETDIRVRSSADSIVLTGSVSDSIAAAQAHDIAQAWVRKLTRGIIAPIVGEGRGGTSIQIGEARNTAQTARVAGPQVLNMLRVRAPMQVMLEVKVAEVSRTLLSRLGVTSRFNHTGGSYTYDILSQSNFFNQLLGAAAVAKNAGNFVQLDAQNDDGLVKLLAEPNIMAISGQEASFRAGGKIFIPVARRNDATGGATVTLEEREFGVGLKFKPTVLEGTRINLQVAPEVSELQQAGTPFTTVDGTTAVLPSFTLRRAETTVQLNDGQSFMIAGLVQNNAATTINRFPWLGDVPILGALFRSTQFQTAKTELMFLITPRLVKPLPADVALPTDYYIAPDALELNLLGRLEGERPAEAQQRGGYEMK